jgi:exo-beta-1,3-glucanase (GH17 family)
MSYYGTYFSGKPRSTALLADPARQPFAPPPDAEIERTPAEDRLVLRELLEAKLHGIAFSPYLDGQSPGTEIPEEQIRTRMRILQPYVDWIRTFSCVEGNQEAPRVAHELGLKTMVGIELSDDRDANELELTNGIEVAKAGHADILAVGNEVLLRGDLTLDELLAYIERAREAVPDVPVSYVDAYFVFGDHPRLAEACDVLLINCYPFWEKCPAEHAVQYMAGMVHRTKEIAGDKRVIISETGWPTEGTPYGASVPSFENACRYAIGAIRWARSAGVEIFYFSSFDEAWKVGAEGDVGAYWGLWDTEGKFKYE